jgi:hypothetical protein
VERKLNKEEIDALLARLDIGALGYEETAASVIRNLLVERNYRQIPEFIADQHIQDLMKIKGVYDDDDFDFNTLPKIRTISLAKTGLISYVSAAVWMITDFGNAVLEHSNRTQASNVVESNEHKPLALPLGDAGKLVEAVAEQYAEDSGYWRSCSGCYETEDGHAVGEYDYSDVFKCPMGGGCRECGGLGAVWREHPEEEYLNSTHLASKGDGWISVEDAMPPEDESVLCYWGDYLPHDIGLWNGRAWQDANGAMERFDASPTHWQPLPAAPQGEQSNGAG